MNWENLLPTLIFVLICIFILFGLFIGFLLLTSNKERKSNDTNLDVVKNNLNVLNYFIEMEFYKILENLVMSNPPSSVGIGNVTGLIQYLSSSKDINMKYRDERFIFKIYDNLNRNLSSDIKGLFYKYNSRIDKKFLSDNEIPDPFFVYITEFCFRKLVSLKLDMEIQYNSIHYEYQKDKTKMNNELMKIFNSEMYLQLREKINQLYNIEKAFDIIDISKGEWKARLKIREENGIIM